GNLCSRNSALIVLLHTPLFLNWLQRYYRAHGQCARRKRCLLCGFNDLANAYWGTDPQRAPRFEDIYLPQVWERVKETFWKDDPVKEQHDVCDFLENFFQQLHRETDAEGWQEARDIFEIRTKNDHVCQTCSHVMGGQTDQKSFLIANFGSEKQPGSDKITEVLKMPQPKFEANCEQCKRQTMQLPREKITYLPEILFVRINRLFYNKKGGTYQLTHPIEAEERLIVPSEILDGPLKSTGEACYELYAIIWHNAQSTPWGHYICVVKDPKGQWAHVDDDDVTLNPSTKAILGHRARQQEAYVLVYRRLPLNRQLQLGPQEVAEVQDVSAVRPTTDDGISGSGQPEPLPRKNPPNDQLPPPQKSASLREQPAHDTVNLDQTIEFAATKLKWDLKEQLIRPVGSGALVQIHGRARIQKAKIQLRFVCEKTGETLIGEGEISLRDPSRRSKKRAAPTVINTRSKKAKKEGRREG
ncbi:cysteine proteinase, partial [Aspergillus ellipticus CBS 707.79]